MRTIIITILLAFIVSASIAQTKTTKPIAPSPKPQKQYTIQLNDQELQQLFALIAMAKSLMPYGKQKAEDKVNTIQFIDEYSEKLSNRIKEVAAKDTIKSK